MEDNIVEAQLESIKELEDKLAHANSINKKNKIRLELKKKLLYAKMIIPFALITGISLSGFSLFISVPFYRDSKRKDLWYKKEFDSLGNKVIEEQYEEYNNVGEVSFVSKWEKYDDTYYSRTITTYPVKSLTEEELERFIMSEEVSLAKVLGNPIATKTEKKNNITEEEINKGAFLRATVYNRSDEDYILIKETKQENITTTVSFIISTFLADLICGIMLSGGKIADNRKKKIAALEDEYEEIDIDSLERKLQIRKDTYDRLK